jgi:hypothetical protein
VPASDPREGLAGVGAAVHALRALPRRAVIGPYAAWVTTPDEFDARVALRERAEYEAYAVTTEAARVRVAGEDDEAPLMFVAFPPAVANATAQLNDWRAQPWLVAAAGDGDGGGPNCELVRANWVDLANHAALTLLRPQLEVLHDGWPHVFVVTSRALAADEELTVQYPRGFWRGRAKALVAYAAADAAVAAGEAAAVEVAAAVVAGGDERADTGMQRPGKKARHMAQASAADIR